jgi:AcrR family transcriptional regulator
MGINPPSLYAKFGNKHTLFMHVLDHYVSTITSTQLSALMEKGDIRQAFSRYFEEIIQCVASPDLPSGCLIASVATEVSERDTIVRKKVRELLAKAEDLIAYRINQNKPENAPFKGLRSRQTARMVLAVGQSLAARARVGEPKARLRELADDFIDHLF